MAPPIKCACVSPTLDSGSGSGSGSEYTDGRRWLLTNSSEVDHWWARCVFGSWLGRPVHGRGRTKFFAITRGSHLCYAFWSVYERDQDFWLAKSVLDHLIILSKGLDGWFFYGSKVRLQPHIFLIFAVWRWPWSLDCLWKGLWLLNSVLILVTNTSTPEI